jgi:translation initiation factor 3 subunit F
MVGEMKLANMFHEVKVELSMTETEATCLFHMIHSQTPPTSAGATAGTARWPGSEVVAAVPAERASVQKAMKQLLEVLDRVQVYVDNVVDGNAPALAEYGMRVADAIAALQEVRPEDFNGVLQEKIQDLLMVNYISSLTNTQLAISEKINQIL